MRSCNNNLVDNVNDKLWLWFNFGTNRSLVSVE